MNDDVPSAVQALRAEYRRSTLDESCVVKDPLEQFSLWFKEALRSDLPEANAVILSTATLDGSPSGRAVLLKDVSKRGFLFFTNYASRKGQDLAANPRAALTFLWSELERQVRVEGRVERCPAEESDRYFHQRPVGSQVAAAISPQSDVVPSREWLELRVQEMVTTLGDRPVPRPPHWGGYWLAPTRIEFWQGRENRLHDRLQYRLVDRAWLISRLAP